MASAQSGEDIHTSGEGRELDHVNREQGIAPVGCEFRPSARSRRGRSTSGWATLGEQVSSNVLSARKKGGTPDLALRPRWLAGGVRSGLQREPALSASAADCWPSSAAAARRWPGRDRAEWAPPASSDRRAPADCRFRP